MADELISLSELRSRAERLLRVGEMPSLDDLLKVIAESLEKYASAIVEARAEMEED